ncbi:MAG: tetratricopeptide repeat protein [Deltaproteobacteria bacterium]
MEENRKKIFLAALLIVCLGAAAYANAPRGAFLWDDASLVEKNAFIRSASHIPQIFATNVGAGAGNDYRFYRPLQVLTYLLEYPLSKTNPAGYHIGNILWHILSALALFWLLNILFGDYLLALIASALFVVHPVHTEAVTYISGLADPLSTAFMLLTLVLYFRSLDGRRFSLFLPVLLSYACALLSRENALILPALLLFLHFALRRPVPWPRFLCVAGLAVAYIVARFTLLAGIVEHKVFPTTIFDRFPGFMAALLAYIRILCLPFRLHMEYGGWSGTLGNPAAFLGLLVFLGLLFVLFARRRKRGFVFFGLGWFLLTLVPVSNLYPLNAFMAEHWLYLPSIGFFLLAAYAFVTGLRRPATKVPVLAGLLALTAFWGVLTYRQNETWLDPIPFFQRLLRYAPQSSRVNNALGMAYNAVGDYKTAVTYLERAVALKDNAAPRDAAKAYNNLALAYNELGRSSEAAQAAQGAVTIDVTQAKAYNNLAISLVRLGKFEEAIKACRQALDIKPGYAKAYNTMAAAFMNLQQYDEALANYGKAIELEPGYPEAYNNMGLLYQKMGKFDQAVPQHQKAIALRPDYANAYNNLAAAYKALGRTQDAVAAYARVVELDPRRGDVYARLAALAYDAGDRAQAAAYYGKAKALGLSDPDLEKKLGP